MVGQAGQVNVDCAGFVPDRRIESIVKQ